MSPWVKALPTGSGDSLPHEMFVMTLGHGSSPPEFFSLTVGLNEAVIRGCVAHQERVDKGQIQLEFKF